MAKKNFIENAKKSLGSNTRTDGYGWNPQAGMQAAKDKTLRGKISKSVRDTSQFGTPIPKATGNKKPIPIPTKIGNAKRKLL